MSIKLSVLVPTVPSRIDFFYPRIIKELLRQTEDRNDVEILGLFDNKKRSIGAKRQSMLDIINGEYVVFIDDDDRISDSYIATIMDAIYQNPDTDCIVFDCIYCPVDNGSREKLCKYGVEFEYGDINGGDEWRGKPAHTMVYKTSIAKQEKYSDMNHGEDIDWVKRACSRIKQQTRIDKVLYYYDSRYLTTSESVGLSDNVINKNIKKLLEK